MVRCFLRVREEEGLGTNARNRNASTPFTYAVNFTNNTSTALFTLNAPYGILTMSFSGIRVDDLGDKYDTYNPRDNGNYTSISLNTSNPLVPNFMFTNGSKIEFRNDSGFWNAAAATTTSGEVEISRPQWLLFSIIAALWAVFLF